LALAWDKFRKPFGKIPDRASRFCGGIPPVQNKLEKLFFENRMLEKIRHHVKQRSIMTLPTKARYIAGFEIV
jgi:hypothetical protein